MYGYSIPGSLKLYDAVFLHQLLLSASYWSWLDDGEKLNSVGFE